MAKGLAAGFAHLLGLGAKRAEGDEESKRARRAEDPDQDEEDKDKNSARRAENEDPDDDRDEDMEEDDESESKSKGKKAKGSRAEDGDDDADAEEDDDEKEKAARLAERARCAAIFRCAEAATRPDMAAHLAFNTGMGSAKAIDMLKVAAAGSAPRSRGLSSRMAEVPNPKVGAEGGQALSPDDPKAQAAAIAAAVSKVRQ
jgi:hypothetical protein